MSTIAYDGTTIAFETQINSNRIEPAAWLKVRPIDNNPFYQAAGGSGVMDAVAAFINWIDAGVNPGPYPELCKEYAGECSFIAITTEGLVASDAPITPSCILTEQFAVPPRISGPYEGSQDTL